MKEVKIGRKGQIRSTDEPGQDGSTMAATPSLAISGAHILLFVFIVRKTPTFVELNLCKAL